MLKKNRSVLGLAAIVTGTALLSGTPRALAADTGSQVYSAATAHGFRQSDRGERRFGPYSRHDDAKRKCHSLERDGWYCHIEKCRDGRGWYVIARKRHG